MNNEPLISIVLPVYNGEKYLKETIQSILNQRFDSFELIIVNDGSTDKTTQIITQLSDNRIILLNQVNSGISIALNSGIKISRAKYIARVIDPVCGFNFVFKLLGISLRISVMVFRFLLVNHS